MNNNWPLILGNEQKWNDKVPVFSTTSRIWKCTVSHQWTHKTMSMQNRKVHLSKAAQQEDAELWKAYLITWEVGTGVCFTFSKNSSDCKMKRSNSRKKDNEDSERAGVRGREKQHLSTMVTSVLLCPQLLSLTRALSERGKAPPWHCPELSSTQMHTTTRIQYEGRDILSGKLISHIGVRKHSCDNNWHENVMG